MGENNESILEEDDNTMKVKKDGSWIPRDRLNEAVGKVKGELETSQAENIRLAEQIRIMGEAPTQQPAQQKAEKVYSLAELRTAVENSTISQPTADQIWEGQQRSEMNATIQSAMKDFSVETTANQTVQSQIKDYVDLLPDMNKTDTKDRGKLQAAYNHLTGVLGLPKENSLEDRKIQLLAMNEAFGPIEAVRNAKSSLTNENRESHQEQLGNQGGDGGSDEKIPKGLTDGQKRHYSRQIENGLYKDWDAVTEELKFAKK
jgi:hypothetical protein